MTILLGGAHYCALVAAGFIVAIIRTDAGRLITRSEISTVLRRIRLDDRDIFVATTFARRGRSLALRMAPLFLKFQMKLKVPPAEWISRAEACASAKSPRPAGNQEGRTKW